MRNVELPIRLRSGGITFHTWGFVDDQFVCDEEPGYILRWPEGPWVSLDVIKRGDWWQFKPEPVRISASRFLVNRSTWGELWITLKPGEYLQGALARRYGSARVYVVLAPPPPEYLDVDRWPRIVNSRRRRPP